MTTRHKALLIKARDVLLAACDDRCNAEYNPCEFREVASELQAVIDAPDEPVGYRKLNEDGKTWSLFYQNVGWTDTAVFEELYPHPAQRQPLSDEQILSMDIRGTKDEALRFARAIEAAHGIKKEQNADKH